MAITKAMTMDIAAIAIMIAIKFMTTTVKSAVQKHETVQCLAI